MRRRWLLDPTRSPSTSCSSTTRPLTPIGLGCRVYMYVVVSALYSSSSFSPVLTALQQNESMLTFEGEKHAGTEAIMKKLTVCHCPSFIVLLSVDTVRTESAVPDSEAHPYHIRCSAFAWWWTNCLCEWQLGGTHLHSHHICIIARPYCTRLTATRRSLLNFRRSSR